MASPLENLVGKSLRTEPPDDAEINGLIRSGKARLKDASNAQLSMESRFDLAYNAAHALCLAAQGLPCFEPLHRVPSAPAYIGTRL